MSESMTNVEKANSQKTLRKKIIFSFVIMVLLILTSGILGWKLTKQVEKSESIIETVHLFKEAELQLRREEKNLIIRGYSEERLVRWQNAKDNFNQSFGQLVGLDALNQDEINQIKSTITQMSDSYNKFFHDIQDHNLSGDEISQYDAQFKKIGRGSLVIIDEILQREMASSISSNSQTNVLIVIFSVIFILIAIFLVTNVLKHL